MHLCFQHNFRFCRRLNFFSLSIRPTPTRNKVQKPATKTLKRKIPPEKKNFRTLKQYEEYPNGIPEKIERSTHEWPPPSSISKQMQSGNIHLQSRQQSFRHCDEKRLSLNSNVLSCRPLSSLATSKKLFLFPSKYSKESDKRFFYPPLRWNGGCSSFFFALLFFCWNDVLFKFAKFGDKLSLFQL